MARQTGERMLLGRQYIIKVDASRRIMSAGALEGGLQLEIQQPPASSNIKSMQFPFVNDQNEQQQTNVSSYFFFWVAGGQAACCSWGPPGRGPTDRVLRAAPPPPAAAFSIPALTFHFRYN